MQFTAGKTPNTKRIEHYINFHINSCCSCASNCVFWASIQEVKSSSERSKCRMPSSRPKRSISSDRLAFPPCMETSDWSTWSAAWAQLLHLSIKLWSCVVSFYRERQHMIGTSMKACASTTQILPLWVHLASVHFNHLEAAQCLRLIFDLLPQLVKFMRNSLHRRVRCFGKGSTDHFTPWFRHISVYIYDRRRVINCIPVMCCDL